MTQPKLRVTNKPARLSSKGGNVWVKTIYIVPDKPNQRARSYGAIYGNTAEEATANAHRFVKLHNATRKLTMPAYFVEQAKQSVVDLHNFAASREDINTNEPIIPQIIKLLSNGH